MLFLESTYPLCLLDTVSQGHTHGRSYREFAYLQHRTIGTHELAHRYRHPVDESAQLRAIGARYSWAVRGGSAARWTALTIAAGLCLVKLNGRSGRCIRCGTAVLLHSQKSGDSEAICTRLIGPSLSRGILPVED